MKKTILFFLLLVLCSGGFVTVEAKNVADAVTASELNPASNTWALQDLNITDISDLGSVGTQAQRNAVMILRLGSSNSKSLSHIATAGANILQDFTSLIELTITYDDTLDAMPTLPTLANLRALNLYGLSNLGGSLDVSSTTSNLTGLQVFSNPKMTGLTLSSDLSKITYAYIFGNTLMDSDLDLASATSALEQIIVYSNPLMELLTLSTDLSGLIYVDVHGNSNMSSDLDFSSTGSALTNFNVYTNPKLIKLTLSHDLSMIQYLKVFNNQLLASVLDLRSLSTPLVALDVYSNPVMENVKLPDNWAPMVNVTECQLFGNSLWREAPRFKNLTASGLSSITLSNNDFTELPSNIFSGATGSIVANLSGNDFLNRADASDEKTAAGAGTSTITQMRTLLTNNSKIHKIEVEDALAARKAGNLTVAQSDASSSITTSGVKWDIPNRYIRFWTGLDTIGSEGELGALEELRAQGNRLRDLFAAETAAKLSALEVLDLSANDIHSLDTATLATLPTTTRIFLGGNPTFIKDMPEGRLKNAMNNGYSLSVSELKTLTAANPNIATPIAGQSRTLTQHQKFLLVNGVTAGLMVPAHFGPRF